MMKPGALTAKAAWLSAIDPELSITNRKSILRQPCTECVAEATSNRGGLLGLRVVRASFPSEDESV